MPARRMDLDGVADSLSADGPDRVRARIAPRQTDTRLASVTRTQVRFAVTGSGTWLSAGSTSAAGRIRVTQFGRAEQPRQTSLAATRHPHITARDTETIVTHGVRASTGNKKRASLALHRKALAGSRFCFAVQVSETESVAAVARLGDPATMTRVGPDYRQADACVVVSALELRRAGCARRERGCTAKLLGIAERAEVALGRAIPVARRANIAADAPGAEAGAQQSRFTRLGQRALLALPELAVAGSKTAGIGTARTAHRTWRHAVDIRKAGLIIRDRPGEPSQARRFMKRGVAVCRVGSDQAVGERIDVDRRSPLVDRALAPAALGAELSTRHGIPRGDAVCHVAKRVRRETTNLPFTLSLLITVLPLVERHRRGAAADHREIRDVWGDIDRSIDGFIRRCVDGGIRRW